MRLIKLSTDILNVAQLGLVASPLVDALPELMTPASAAQGVPSLTEPGEGVGQGWASESTISGVSGRPQGDSKRC
jgi:hypothetical protein